MGCCDQGITLTSPDYATLQSVAGRVLEQPLPGLAQAPATIAANESVNVPGGGNLDLLSIPSGTSGVVRDFWMALGFNATPWDMRLQVTVDGEAQPAIDVDLASLFVAYPAVTGIASTAHVHVEGTGTGSYGVKFSFPMPFSDGIRVRLFNPTGALIIVYSMVTWDRCDEVPPYRLRAKGQTRLAPAVLTQAQTLEVLNEPTGPGWLVYWGECIFNGSPANGSFIERNMVLDIDGVPAAWRSTGNEDWLGSSFSMQGRIDTSSNHYLVGAINDNTALTAAVDLVNFHGGLRWCESIVATYSTEAGVTAGHSMGWCLLYYLHT